MVTGLKLRRPIARPLSVTELAQRAFAIMGSPPARDFIVRVEPEGDFVARFVLPLQLVQPQNRTHGKTWLLGKLKSQCLLAMRAQLRERRDEPLPGRPQVLCVRFSSRAPDKYNDGFKCAIDRLRDLKLIVDDAPEMADVHQWWEATKVGEGFGLIEVFSGAQSAGKGG